MIFIVNIFSRKRLKNVSKAALFEHSLKKLFQRDATLYVSSQKTFLSKIYPLKKLFSQKSVFTNVLTKNFSLKIFVS